MTKAEVVEYVAKGAGDGASFAVVIGTLANYLPAVAALLSIVWTAIRISETATVRRWFGKKVD